MKTCFYFLWLPVFVAASVQAQVSSIDGTFSSGSVLTNTSLRTGTNTRMTILSSNGYIGINTPSPTTYLDVNGYMRIRWVPVNNTLTQMLMIDGLGNVNTRNIFPFVTSSSHLGLGYNALPVSTGYWNVAVGVSSLASNSTGQSNTALGHEAMLSNTTGESNVGVGFQALYSQTGTGYNIAVGYRAGFQNTASNTIAVGYKALYVNTGQGNTALGNSALYSNTSGAGNTAAGNGALAANTTGHHSAAFGYNALTYAVSDDNTAIGSESQMSTTGIGNTSLGSRALYTNRSGSNNTALGFLADTHYDNLTNTVALGAWTTTDADNQVRIGNTWITSIGGQVSWSTLSDGRFKKDVKEDVAGLELIRQLRPVSYVVDIDAQEKFLNRPDSLRPKQARQSVVRQTGFIAQEVEQIVKAAGYTFQAVDAPQDGRGHYSLRYADFVVPLVRAVQELSAQVEELQRAKEEQTAARDGAVDKTTIVLYQNTPNPFTTNTTIAMTLPDNVGYAAVVIYNLEGKQLKRIDVTTRGDVKVAITAQELPAGMYLYSLIADGKIIDTKRMVLTD